MTPLEAAYAAHTPGSAAFLAAVDFAGRYQVTRTEAKRIALESDSAAAWEKTWRDEMWWKGSVAEKGEMTVRQANWCQCSRWESGRRKKASHHLHPESWAVIREADG